MATLPQALADIAQQLAAVRVGALPGEAASALSTGEQIEVLRDVGEIQRMLDAVVVDVVDDIETQDAGRERTARVTARAGCRGTGELLQRTLLIDRAAARRYVTAAGAAHEEVALVSRERLPGSFPELTAALTSGEVSLAGYLACIVPLQRAQSRIAPEDLAVADTVLARVATGRDISNEGELGERAPRPTVEELAGLVAHVLLRLDPDGTVPDDQASERNRAFSIGRLRAGGVPVRGNLLPEVAAALQRLIDAYSNPRVRFAPSAALLDPESDVPPETASDPRTASQRRHDAFAAIIASVAAAEAAPQLGGAAPTLVVSVSAGDFSSGVGRAHLHGTEWDAPMSTARHAACTGGVQRVLFDDAGAIIGISTSARIFTSHQRKAIQLRDRECLIPGCHVRADWCEVHHVQEWAQGGPTHTGNGVALCWHHHRTLDASGWQIRMRHGVPEIRGPAWWDPHCRWRRPGDAYRAVDRLIASARGG